MKVSGQNKITCEVKILNGDRACIFNDVTIGEDEKVTIDVDPADSDVSSIKTVDFDGSSLHSVPSELFIEFPNLEILWADQQSSKEIKPKTFVNAKKLKTLFLYRNNLTQLDVDIFEGGSLLYFPTIRGTSINYAEESSIYNRGRGLVVLL